MNLIASYLDGVIHPEAYHGNHKKSNFFEGWYIKLVSADQSHRIAIIPGIFKGLSGSKQADESFVQVLDGSTGKSWYHKFPKENFKASQKHFQVSVAENAFSSTGLSLNLPSIQGEVRFTTAMDPWPVTLTSPGIMGWYGMVPFMECFHGVVSFGHGLSGSMTLEGKEISFEGGRGYIEKDWGQAFPSGYIWLHSNHLQSQPEASFVGSVAIIPWLGKSFRGFIVGLKHSGKLHRWTTYNSSKERILEVTDEMVRWTLEGKDGVLEITANRKRGGLLHAPLREAMHQRVEETLDGEFSIRHLSAKGELILETMAKSGGMEVYGDIEKLVAYE